MIWTSSKTRFAIVAALLAGIWFNTVANDSPWNNPHPADTEKNTRYSAFASIPKTLDPARAYSSDEIQIIAQIYEPPLQYHYLMRPYQLIPTTLQQMPKISYYSAQNKLLPNNPDPKTVAYTVYDLYLKSGIYYQPHPAFAKDSQGNFLYDHLTAAQLHNIQTITDFPKPNTRELTADDYVYEIKRLASPQINSPIFGLMSKYIIGMNDFAKQIPKTDDYVNLNNYSLAGAKVISRYHYQIKIHGFYPQFLYWLSMPFFAPIPWEAEKFYAQPGLIDKNITLSWYPVGTGPYWISENNPNKQIILLRNPNFHYEIYPTQGEASDQRNGFLKDAGHQLPFINKIVLTLDKESLPRWNKFLQGYYDYSGIGSDNFDEAIRLNKNGQPELTPALQAKGVQLQTTVSPGIFYTGFNMLDPVVGNKNPNAQKLRQALAIALNQEEYIAIFLNGRGIPAQGPIPPGVFGYVEGPNHINPYLYEWKNNKAQRRSILVAKQLLAEAGYPNGIDPLTKKPLVLNFDVAASGNPSDAAYFNWMRKQFAQLGIELNIRSTLYNRFQDKVRTGDVQLFSWGWAADYPDPENFLFLLYGPNGKVKFGGENATNYDNPAVNRLFEAISVMPNGPARQQKINELISIVQKDTPWIWGFHPVDFTLSHSWNRLNKPHSIANNTLKYQNLDASMRAKLQQQWNQPEYWPLWLAFSLVILLIAAVAIGYWQRECRPNVERF